MRFARPALAIAGCAAALLTLTACEQPTPGVSVFSGTTSQHHYAICWVEPPAQVDSAQCSAEAEAASTEVLADPITVVPGDTVGISVDPALTDNGWVPVLNGTPLTQQPLTSTYFRFTVKADDFVNGSALLQAYSLSGQGLGGVWSFGLAQPQ